MGEEIYIDLEVLASMDDEYLVRIGKDSLNTLVLFDDHLVVRHWDGGKPVLLEPYGENAVRTRQDESSTNNLEELPEVDGNDILNAILAAQR
jgi:hypothetical protein